MMSNQTYKKDLKIDSSYDILNDYLNVAVRPTTTGEITTNLPSRDVINGSRNNRVMAGLVSPSHNTRKLKKDYDNIIESGGGGGKKLSKLLHPFYYHYY